MLARTLLYPGGGGRGAHMGLLRQVQSPESSLASLLSLDNTLKPAWINIMEQSKGVEVSS